MDENRIEGGAGPALAAHSKDASATGPTPASSAVEHKDGAAAGSGGGGFGEGIRAAVGRAAGVRDDLSGQAARAGDQVAEFVRAQPFAALAVTGALGLALGLLLARR